MTALLLESYRQKAIREYEEERKRRDIMFGECFCGCKQKTAISPRDSELYRDAKGQPRRFIQHHHSRHFRYPGKLPSPIIHEEAGVRYCLVPLTREQFTRISPHQYERIMQRKWYAIWQGNTQSFYAGCKGHYADGRRGVLFLHRFILGLDLDDPRTGDHVKSEETLNNTDGNLRIATYGEQACNKGRPCTNTTGYIGVLMRKDTGLYRAHIASNRKKISLGEYTDPEVAARVRDLAAIRLHGDFASLNFPRSDYRTRERD